jgi:hypothetical protein
MQIPYVAYHAYLIGNSKRSATTAHHPEVKAPVAGKVSGLLLQAASDVQINRPQIIIEPGKIIEFNITSTIAAAKIHSGNNCVQSFL